MTNSENAEGALQAPVNQNTPEHKLDEMNAIQQQTVLSVPQFNFPKKHLHSAFGDDWFALKAEKFARFFGTPLFLISQTIIVIIWIGINALGLTSFDVYPFILLNLAFSLQAAYAAPLILLAQTRQADRDKAHSEADSAHRDAIAEISTQHAIMTQQQSTLILDLLQQNTELTKMTHELSQRIEKLTTELHRKMML